jgi:hypothetical protein
MSLDRTKHIDAHANGSRLDRCKVARLIMTGELYHEGLAQLNTQADPPFNSI